VAGTNDPTKTTNVGKVKHLFKPSSYFKEAYDANHFVNNSPEIQNKNVADIAKQIANNGSFSNTSVAGQIKKSFSYEVPVNSWLYKSYNNPYSTVMSSSGAQTIDGKELSSDRSNSTIQPQKVLDLNNPNNPDATLVSGDPTKIELSDNAYVEKIPSNEAKFMKSGSDTNYLKATDRIYYYFGIYKNGTGNTIHPDPSRLDDGLKIKFNDINNTISILPGYFITGSKFGAIGTGSIFPHPGTGQIGGFYPIDPNNNNIDNIYSGKVVLYDNIGFSSINLSESDKKNSDINGDDFQWFVNINGNPWKNIKSWSDSQYFVQTWDKNTLIKNGDGQNPKPLIYNQNILGLNNNFSSSTLGQVDSPNFEAKYYIEGYFILEPSFSDGKFRIKAMSVNDHLSQTAKSKRAYFNSNLYNNPKGDLTQGSTRNNSRFFVSQDFSIGPVSSDMINDAGPDGSGVDIEGTYYPYGKEDPKGSSPEANAAKILELAVKYNNPLDNDLNQKADTEVKSEFTNQGGDGNEEGNDGSGYKLVSIADAANKQGVSEAALANEVAKVTGKDAREVRNTKWVQATLPRLKQNVGKARINVVIYDKSKDAASNKPVISKKETKPSFSITDVFSGNGASNVALQPSTITYDDGAVVKAADVPQSFQNLLKDTLVAGNPDLVNYPNRLQDVLVNAFLNSWQQIPLQADKKSPNYLAGGFGISNSDTKNSYSQWPSGYAANTGAYLEAVNHYPGDFYRGGKDLQLIGGGSIDKIPFSSLQADVSKVDLKTVGTYPVVYTYTNPKNAQDTAKITVPVTVKSTNSPVFVFRGGNDLTLHVGDQFNANDYKIVGNRTIYNQYHGDYSRIVNGEGIAKDSSGKPIVTITGQVDVNQPGVYRLTYEAANLSGIKAKLVRQITVLPSDKKPENKEWQVSDFKSIGYVNYVPGYGINVWDAPAGVFTGQRLAHGSAWKIFEKAVNDQGEVYYKVGKNQWLDGKYVAFNPVSEMESLKGIAVINYIPGYGVNLWKTPTTTGGYYQRKLADKSRWKVFGKQNGFYNVGKNQWIQGKYAKFETK
ncbi:MAG: immunoglobulin-like domain-containing protein, partial [Bombilactobacillus sp.]